MKKILILILMILMATSVLGIEICGDTESPVTDCRLMTPSLVGCGIYNYTITEENGTLTQKGNLTNLYGDIYYVDIVLNKGSYLVELCDGTTREIIVREGGGMLIALVIGLSIIPFVLLAFTFVLDKSKVHNIIRLFTYSFAIYSINFPIHFGLVLSENTDFYNTLLTASKGVTWFFICYMFYVFILVILMVLQNWKVLIERLKLVFKVR